MSSIVINILLALNVIVSLLIILFVLMQRPKSEGLGAAFGGGMTENLFGAQTSNVLSTITRWLGGIFFALTLMLSVLYARQSTTKSSIQQQLLENAKPVPSVKEESKKQITDKEQETSLQAPAASASPDSTAASAPVTTPTTPSDEKAAMPVQPTATPAPAPTVAPAEPTATVATPEHRAAATPAAKASPKATKPSPTASKHKKP